MVAGPDIVPDSQYRGLTAALPHKIRAFWLLARFDRPIGWQLLFWPGAWGVALAGGVVSHWHVILLILIGAVAMRGAGCVYNDIVDRDLDRQVARTRARPLASGAVSLSAAWAWLVLLCLVGLAVLVALGSWTVAAIACASLAPVAAYPFMKRITWWPQAWLGIVFSWAAPVGWAAVTGWPDMIVAPLLLYLGSILWVIGYDTLYALQDREDDALIGIRSSALRMGRHVRGGVALLYLGALLLWGSAIWTVRPQPLALAALLPAATHFAWQILTLKEHDPLDPLTKFRSNRFAGLLVFLACATVGSAG